jgi:hypothetical protein
MAGGLDAVLERAESLPTQLLNDLKADTGELTWFEQEFDLVFRVDDPRDSFDESENRDIIKNFEAALLNQLHLIATSMMESGKRILALKNAGLDRKKHLEMFPWLPWPGTVIVLQPNEVGDALVKQFDLKAPLNGQKKEGLGIELGQISAVRFIMPKFQVKRPAGTYFGLRKNWWRDMRVTSPFAVIPIARFELLSLEFEAGSLWPKARVRKQFIAGAFALLSLGFVNDRMGKATDKIRQHTAHVQSLKTAEKGPAVEFCGARWSLDKLRDLQEDALDYTAPGISEMERTCRAAEVQVGLNKALNLDMPVDGKPGNRTHAAEQQFGRDNKVRGTIKDESFRGKLALVFKDPSEK